MTSPSSRFKRISRNVERRTVEGGRTGEIPSKSLKPIGNPKATLRPQSFVRVSNHRDDRIDPFDPDRSIVFNEHRDFSSIDE